MISSIQTQQNLSNGSLSKEARLAGVAREFEQMFASMMIRSMRKTVPESPLMNKSMGEKIYTDMLDGEYARMMVNNKSLGLAEKIVEQMSVIDGSTDMTAALDALKHDYSHLLAEKRFGSSYQAKSSIDPQPDIVFSPRIRQWDAIIDKASAKYGVDRELIAAVIEAESNGNALAISPVGAKGLMQLMDGTAKDMGVTDSLNPEQNIMGGTKYLKRMLEHFDNDTSLALAAYNAGPATVERYNGVPPYQETQNYVEKITARITR